MWTAARARNAARQSRQPSSAASARRLVCMQAQPVRGHPLPRPDPARLPRRPRSPPRPDARAAPTAPRRRCRHVCISARRVACASAVSASITSSRSPGHDLIELVERQVDAVIGHAALREVVGADALRAVARAHLRRARWPAFLCALPLDVVKPGLEHLQRDLAVAVLRFLRRGHHDPGGKMGDAHRRIGGVHVLPAGARGAHRVDAQVVGSISISTSSRLGQHRHRRRRGVDAPARFGLRHPLHPVHAGFELQPRETPVPRPARPAP